MASPPGEGGSESRVVTINVVYSDHVAERFRDLVAVELVMAFQDEGQFDEDMDGSFLGLCRCPALRKDAGGVVVGRDMSDVAPSSALPAPPLSAGQRHSPRNQPSSHHVDGAGSAPPGSPASRLTDAAGPARP